MTSVLGGKKQNQLDDPYFDFKEAFGGMLSSTFLRKLPEFGVIKLFIQWIVFYFTDRYFTVHFGNVTPKEIKCTARIYPDAIIFLVIHILRSDVLTRMYPIYAEDLKIYLPILLTK